MNVLIWPNAKKWERHITVRAAASRHVSKTLSGRAVPVSIPRWSLQWNSTVSRSRGRAASSMKYICFFHEVQFIICVIVPLHFAHSLAALTGGRVCEILRWIPEQLRTIFSCILQMYSMKLANLRKAAISLFRDASASFKRTWSRFVWDKQRNKFI